MRCKRCGASLEDDALVCGQCGGVVGASYGPPGNKPVPGMQPRPAPRSLIAETPRLARRVKALLRSPRSEWPVIAHEPSSSLDLYMGYAMPLAAIGALAFFVAQVVFGVPVPLIGVVKATLVAGLAGALLGFAFALLHLFLFAAIVRALAPRFGGEPDRAQALKLAAYAFTPVWLAGVLQLVPPLAFIGVIAWLYALYLAFVGLPVVMRCREEGAVGYALLACGAAFMLYAVFAGVTTAILGFGPPLFD